MARARPTLLEMALVAALALNPAADAAALPLALPLAPVAANTGLAFSGSGFLGVFHLGVLQALQDLGLATQATRVAGTSGGSLISGMNCLGLGHDDALAVATGINNECRGQWSCAGQLDKAVKGAMRKAVTLAMAGAGYPRGASQADRDAFVVKRCAGRARFTVSVVDGAQRAMVALKAAKPWFVSDFKGEDDFVSAGAASSFIPIFSGDPARNKLVVWHTLFRGDAAVDGGFSAGLPPCVPGVGACVTIEAVTKDPGAPGMPGMGPPTGPADPPADISPGKFSPLPDGLTRKQWQNHALIAPSDKLARDMERHGADQAVLWACGAYPDLMLQTGKCSRAGGGGGGSVGGGAGLRAAATAVAPLRKMVMPMMRG
jgi:hypothetical protein